MVQRHEGSQGRLGVAPSPDDVDRWLPRLSRLVERGCALCRELDALSASQSEIVRCGDTDSLLRVLAERQQWVDQLAAITTELEPFRREWEAYIGRLSPTDREPLERRVRDLTELIDRIGQRDELDRQVLEAQRRKLNDEIGSVSRGRGAMAAYAGARPPEARFQDRQG